MAPDPDADTTQRLRMNHPGTVLKNYWRATGVKPVLERDNPSAPLDLGPILRDPIQ